MSERALEGKLTERLKHLFLELGRWFAFVGSQCRIEVGGEDFYIDVLFYRLHLRRFVLIDLKAGKFKPEHVGKTSFYLTAVDRQLRHPQDEPSIGLILCRERNRVVAEYALHDLTRPLGVATYLSVPRTPYGAVTSLRIQLCFITIAPSLSLRLCCRRAGGGLTR